MVFKCFPVSIPLAPIKEDGKEIESAELEVLIKNKLSELVTNETIVNYSPEEQQEVATAIIKMITK